MNTTRGIRRQLAIWTALVTAGVTLSVTAAEIGNETAYAATGTITLEPSGSPTPASFSGPTEFTASGACPDAATRYRITMVGGGVSPETNLTGNETFPEGVHTVEGITASAGNFEAFALANNFTLAGVATVKILCISGLTTVMPDGFQTTVTFSGTGASTAYTSGGTAPSVTASPSPSPTSSTSPSPTVSTSPDPTVEPTDTPDDDTDTDTTDDATDDTGGGDTTTDEESGGNLPGTGAQDPKQIITIGILFALTGWLVTIFEGATRPREDGW